MKKPPFAPSDKNASTSAARGVIKGPKTREILRRAVGRCFEPLEHRQMLSAVVTTDKADYAPGSTAHLTASNDSNPGIDFQQGETVQFQVRRTDGQPDFPNGNLPWQVTDGVGGFTPYFDSSIGTDGIWVYPDADGQADAHIETTWFVEPQYAGASLQVTAEGLTSHATASEDFTDGVLNANIASPAAGDTMQLSYTSYTTGGQVDSGGSGTGAFGTGASKVNAGNDPHILLTAPATSDKFVTVGGQSVHPVFSFWSNDQNATTYTSRTVDVGSTDKGNQTWTAHYVAPTQVTFNTPVVTAPSGNAQGYKLGTPTTFHLGSFADPDNGPWTVSVNWGDGTAPTTFTQSTTGALPDTAHTYASGGQTSYAITVTVTDSTPNSPAPAPGPLSGSNSFLVVSSTTTTTVVSSQSPSNAGTAINFTSTVSVPAGAGSPTGTVQFYIDGVAFGSPVALTGSGSSKTALSGSTSTLSAGNHTVTATYSGDSTFASSSGTTTQVVNAVSSSLTASSATGTYGGTTNLSATLLSGGIGVSGKTVTFSLNGTVVGTGTTNASGVATLSNVSLSGVNAGAYAGGVTVGFAGDGTYAAANGSASLTVNRATVTPTVTVNNKVYDRATAATIATRTLGGVLGGDAVTLTGGTATFADRNVGTGKAVTVTGLSLSGAAAANYQLSSNTATTAADITALALTGGFTASNKVYDRTTAASVGGTSLPGVIAGDTVNLVVSGAAFADRNVGTGKTVTGSLSLSGADAGNYTVNSTATTTADVTAKALIGSFAASNKTYDGTASATVATSSLTGVISGDTVALIVGTATFADPSAGTGKTVTAALTLGGADAGNYTVNTTATATADIAQRAITVTANSLTKTYGNADPALTYSITSGSLVAGDLITGALSRAAGEDVGSYAIGRGSLSAGSNYDLSFVSGELTVNRATLNISVGSFSRTYGDPNPSFTGGYAGAKNGETFTVTGTTAAVATSGVGNYAVTAHVTGATLSNYDVVATDGTLAVTAAHLTVSANAAQKTYGDTYAGFGGTVGGIKNGDPITASYGSGGSGATSGVGPYAIAATLNDPTGKLGNYVIDSDLANVGTLTVGKARLTVTPGNATRVYGDANPSFGGTITGVRNGDAVTATYATAATPGSDVGGYDILATLHDPTSKLGNYDVTLDAGTLTVTKAVLTVTADDKAREYGDANPSFTASVSGFKNGENLASSGVNGSAALATGATATSDVGDYVITATLGSLTAGNYSFTFAPGTLAVTKAQLDIYGPSVTRIYGHANPSLGGTFTGAKNGETFTVTGTTAAGNASPVGDYLITPSVSGPTLANYDVVAHAGNLAVTAADLDVYVADASRIYGDANPTSVTSYSGEENGETFTVTATTPATAASSAGTYTITPTASGLTLSNYIVHTHTGSLDVTRATLTIHADNKSRTYGAPDPIFTGSYDGEKNGESFTLSFTSSADAQTSVGTYSIVPHVAGATLGNYTVVVDNGTLAIGKAHLVVTANDKTRVYGQANPALDGTLVGVVAGDDVTATYTTTATQLSNVTAGGFGITPHLVDPNGRLGNYDVETNDGTLTITKADQTITWSDPGGIVYGTPLGGTQLNAVIAGVAGGSPTGAVTYTPAAGTVLDAGQGQALTVSVAGTGNYNPATKTVHIDVAKATPVITLTAPSGAVYDADPHAATALIDGVNGDVLSLTSVRYFSGSTLLPGAPVNAGTYKVVASFAGDANYNAAAEERTFSIAKADQTITWATPGVITYGTAIGAAQLNASVAGVAGGTAPGALSYDLSLGDVLHAGAYTLTVDAAATANYNAASAQVSLTVAKASPVVDLTAPSGAVYIGSAHPATATITGVNDDTLTLGALTYYAGSAAIGTPLGGAPTDAGTYTVVASFAGDANYLPQSEQATFTVAKKSLTISVDSSTKTYGDANPTFSVGYSGFVAGEDQDDLGGALSFATGATQSSDVGHYAISASGLTSGNYDITYVDGDLEITRKALTITANNMSKVYGAANPAFTASYNGFVLGQGSADLAGTLSFTTAATAASNVGTYSVTPGGLTSGNYAITFVAGTLSVTKAALTVLVNNSSKVYGSSNPGFSVSYSGFVSGDNAGDLGGALGFATSATQSSDVGHYAVSASGLTSGNYDIRYEDGDLEVTKKALTVRVNDAETTYGTAPTPGVVSYSGFVLGQDSSVLGGSLQFSGAGINAGSYTISASGLTSGNYDISYQTGTLTVDKAALTVTTDAKGKTYGDTFGAFTGSVAGLKYGDDITAAYGSAGAAATATVGGGPYVITPTLADPDGKLDNYDVTYVLGTLTVNKASLAVTPADVSRLYGGANPTLTGSIVGIKNGDAISASYATSATSASHVASYDITASLDDPAGRLSNYDVTLNTGTLTITKAELTITADNKSMTYGGTLPALTATYTGLVNGDTAGAIGNLVLATVPGTSHAGTYAITAGGATSGDYDITLVDGTLTINKAALTITADDKSMSYGGVLPALTASYGGLVNGDTAAAITGLHLSTAPATSHAGSHAIVASGASSGDYDITLVNGTLTIGKAALTIKADDKAMTYGGTLPALTASYTGLVNGDTSGAISGLVLSTVPASSHAGSYAIAAGGATSGDYDITLVGGTLTIDKAAVTITADDKTMVYGSARPGLTFRYTGLVNGDTGVDVLPILSTASGSSHVGSYAITAAGAEDGDYDIRYVAGTLTISRAALTVTVDDFTKTYGEANPVFSVTYNGFVNGDDENDLGGSLVYSTAATAASHVGDYDVTATGLISGDYAITYVTGNLQIGKAHLGVEVNDSQRTYGDANPTFGVTFDGFVNGDDAGDLGGAVHFTTAAGATSNVGTYAVSANGLTSGDYDIFYADGTVTITKAQLDIYAASTSRTYGDANPTFGTSYSGQKNGETFTVTGTTAATAGSSVGNYTITPGVAGATLGNYDVVVHTGTLTINKAALVVTPGDFSRAYGSANPAFTGSVLGIKNGDAITASYGTTATSASHVGSYDITPSLSDPTGKLANYDVTLNTGTLTITRAALTITADNQTMVYGGTVPALTYHYTGLVNGDAAPDVAPTLSTVAANSHVGGYDITVGGASDADYSITFVKGSLTVTRAALTITANNKSMTYGGTQPALTATYNGLVNGDTGGDISGLALSTVPANSHAGSYVITASGATSGDYVISLVNGTLTINKAALTITADNKTMTYGGTLPALTASYTGLVNGDTAASIGGLVLTTAPATSHVGSYAITAGGATSGDYDITFVAGSLTVAKADTTASTVAVSGIFGGPNATLTATVKAVAPSLATVAEGTVTFTIKQGGTVVATVAGVAVVNGTATSPLSLAGLPVGSYTIEAAYVPAAGGPNFTASLGTSTLAIAKAATTTTVSAVTTTYGGSAGDPTGWNVLLTANVASNSPSSAVVNEGTVVFTVKRGTSAMGTFTGSVSNGVGTAAATFNSSWFAGGYTIDASYVPATTAPNFLASAAGTPASLTIVARAGLTAYIGGTSFITSSSGTTTTQVVLTASVVDQTGNSVSHSVAANTFATFWYIDPTTLQKVVVASNVPVKLVSNTDSSTGTATTTVTLSAGQYGLMSYQIHVDITGSYVSNNDQQFDPARVGTTTVTVYTPTVKNTIRGRGDLLVDAGTAGTYAGEASYVVALNYTNGKSYNPQGNVVLTIRKADANGVIHTYVVKTNSITSLTFGTQATPTSPKQATLYAKASIYEVVTNANGTTSTLSIDGNVTVRVDMTDGGNGVADTIGFTILSKNSDLYYSNNWVYSSAVGGWNTVAEKETSSDWDGVSNDLAVLIS